MKEELYGLANHIAGAKGGLPQDWQDWANEIETDLRRLANREAQPVGFRYRHKDTVSWLYNDWRWPDSVEAEQCQIEWLYTAPPAPAMVNGRTVDGWMAEALLQKGIAEELRKQAPAVPEEMKRDPDTDVFDPGFMNGWNSCRAAMMQNCASDEPSIDAGLTANKCENCASFNQPVSQGYALPESWISRDERMPRDGDVVLVFQEGGIIFCAEVDDGEFYPDEFPRVPTQGREITHWMPLPAAPEGGNG